jgi:hypothetical protein
MKYLPEIQAASGDPALLEQLSKTSQQENSFAAFKEALFTCHDAEPENLLYAAWYYRLHDNTEDPSQKPGKSINWKLAVPASILTGLAFWGLSSPDLELPTRIPHLVILWAPVATLFAMGFLALTSKTYPRRFLAAGASLAALCIYVLLIYPGLDVESMHQQRYLELMIPHLPLAAWLAIGYCLLGFKSAARSRFAFLVKSIEVMVTAGVYLIAGMAFFAITMGMLDALSVNIPDVVMRLMAAGGFGLIPVLSLSSGYDPNTSPVTQDFNQGLSKFVATLMRLLLPLTLGVLVIYIFIIPFKFMEPFNNRDVLIVYNLMLFAIMGLLIGATPISPGELSPRVQNALRRGITVVAGLAALVSIYALSAVIYRTALGGITINRLTIIGWNSINIGILILLIIRQIKSDQDTWVERLRGVFSIGANAYLIWTLFLILVVPLLFRL